METTPDLDGLFFEIHEVDSEIGTEFMGYDPMYEEERWLDNLERARDCRAALM